MASRSWDIFCSVVDNYGDIGVCWRLARQLADEHAQSVRMWVSDLESFHRLCHAVDPAHAVQRVGALEVCRWSEPFAEAAPADIVIEGFGARLPESFVKAMAARSPRPVWINLEYLSAEEWVDTRHGLPSPHPRLPLVKYIFFPGFSAATGGLLVERNLAVRRDEFQRDAAAMAEFCHALKIVPPAAGTPRVSLFCYDNEALPALVRAWRSGSTPILCIVPEGTALAQISSVIGRPVTAGSRVELDRLTIAAIPFLELDDYDRLLWMCDVNFVRGEDSFVRAQLAARPFIWQAYPQDERAHLRKAEAFIERYVHGLDTGARTAWREIMEGWNRQSADVGRAWPALVAQRTVLASHAADWATRITAGRNLAAALADFCEHL